MNTPLAILVEGNKQTGTILKHNADKLPSWRGELGRAKPQTDFIS